MASILFDWLIERTGVYYRVIEKVDGEKRLYIFEEATRRDSMGSLRWDLVATYCLDPKPDRVGFRPSLEDQRLQALIAALVPRVRTIGIPTQPPVPPRHTWNFPTRLVGKMFHAYCEARKMDPNDWPIIGEEKQRAWIEAANAADKEVRSLIASEIAPEIEGT